MSIRSTLMASTAAIAIALLSAAVGASANAQTSDDQSAQARNDGGSSAVELIIVTAEKRSTDLQKTSIAATVLQGDQLLGMGVVQLSDLQKASPSLSIQGAGLTQNVNIRGIGLNSGSPQVVPGVASYRDGLWEPPVVNTDSFYDIADIQVLRGPQGTFVGTNSTGGAIFVTSQSPNFDGFHGYVQAKVGNYSDFGGEGAANLPVTDEFAARIAFKVENRDSFYKQVGSATTTPGALDERNGRLGLLWQPNDDLKILFKSEVGYKSTDGYAMTPAPTTTYYPFAPKDPFTLDYDTNTKNEELGIRNSLQIDWTIFGNGTVLRSISGYQYLHVRNIYDIDATSRDVPFIMVFPGPPFPIPFQPKQVSDQLVIERPITQEFNLISPGEGRFQWILGVFYLHDTRKVALTNPSDGIPSDVVLNLFTTLQAEAVFGQASFDITPSLQVQAGLRYTHDSSENRPTDSLQIYTPPPYGPGVIFVPGSGKETDNVTTGKVALNYTFDKDNFLYAFAAKGFKAGGFDLGLPVDHFAPEVVWDYEAGWKATLFNQHVRTQIGGFYNDYTNLQVSATNLASGQVALTNIGKSTIKGIEASAQGKFGGWGFDLNAAYVYSKLGSLTIVDTTSPPFPNPAPSVPQCTSPGVPAGCFDYTPFLATANGNPNPFSPHYTFHVGTEYTFTLANSDTVTPRVNYTYISSQWSTLLQLHPATDFIAGRGLWDVQLTYNHGDWRAEAYATNLFDQRYIIGQFGLNNFEGAPRQFGGRLSRTF